MKIINEWIFCNRYTSSGKLVPCAIKLNAISEIAEYDNGCALFIIDNDYMFETNVDIIDALNTLEKYLNESK